MIATILLSTQQIFPEIGVVFGLIGFVSTTVLFSLEYRYDQAWFTLLLWAEHSLEDNLFGDGEGPLNSYRDWYILNSKLAANLLYFLLMAIWLGDALYYTYRILL